MTVPGRDPSDLEGWNQRLFNSHQVVSEYAGSLPLTPCETTLFERHLRDGMDILDLGVGAGRTTPSLLEIADRYVGVDYAEAMIRSCRERYPDAEFRMEDASDLGSFEDESFDAVVFSFNGIDCLYPDAAREACLRACARVLRPGGTLILSCHNPVGVLTRPDLRGLSWWRKLRRYGKAALLAVPRFLKAARGALWRGHGYIMDPVHGGLLSHLASRRSVRRELAGHGFELLESLPSTFPDRRPGFMIPWHYYAFRRAR